MRLVLIRSVRRQVRVGDLLVSIDGTDVAGLTNRALMGLVSGGLRAVLCRVGVDGECGVCPGVGSLGGYSP